MHSIFTFQTPDDLLRAMFDDDDKPKPQNMPVPLKLDDWSVPDMNEYIEWLESEIARVKTVIEKRGGMKSAAEAFFKK